MANTVDCICNVLEPIRGFFSLMEFNHFQEYIRDIVLSGELVEVPAEDNYWGFAQQWFQCKECQEKWRLVHPDFPFKGIWDRVDVDAESVKHERP